MAANVNCSIDPMLYKEFKSIVAIKDVTIKDVITKFIQQYVDKERKARK